ncbi:MAG: sulfatase-like hydrolase/transferase, partial [Verrucomicrobiota bacterium]
YSWYADFVAETDWVVGEILAQLEESGIADNTLVIFTADNGFAPYVQIPKMFAAGYRPSGDLRGAKATLFEGGHRVPFLVRWPAQVASGSHCHQTLCTTDFFATFAEILGQEEVIPEDAAEDSFSFYGNLKGSEEPIRPFTIHHSIGGDFAIRKGPWKLLLSNKTKGSWGGLPGKEAVDTPVNLVQLYHLGNDPGETQNLESVHPERIEELIELLAQAMTDGRTTPGSPQSNEGWPFLDKKLMEHFPQLKAPE